MPERNEVIRRDQQKIVQKAYISDTGRHIINMPGSDNSKPAKGGPLTEKKLNSVNYHSGQILTDDGQPTISEMGLDNTMSESIEQVLFNGQLLKKRAAGECYRPASKDLDLCGNDTRTDSSILHIDNMSETSSGHATDSSTSIIFPLKKRKDTEKPVTSNDVDTETTSLNINSAFKGISLKDFESHRKMIEEQNRQKKELLYQAIQEQ